MKYLKYFESEHQFREVDLQLLWDDLNYYQFELFDKPKHTDYFFYNQILKPLLLDKEIEFLRAVHPYDKEVTYGDSGKVKEIKVIDTHKFGNLKKIIVNLYPKKEKYPRVRARDTASWIIAEIDSTVYFPKKKIKKPIIIKIYNSELLEIENKLELLKNKNKYNL